MKRRLFTLWSAISLLLCLVTVVLWVRGYSSLDTVYLHWNGIVRGGGSGGANRLYQKHVQFRSCRGIIQFGWDSAAADFMAGSHMGAMNPPGLRIGTHSVVPAPSPRAFLLGTPWGPFDWYAKDERPKPLAGHLENGVYSRHRYLAVPVWLIAILTLVLPTSWARARLRGVTPGICARCGYDLRATPCRCPNCGAVPENANA